NFRSQQEILDFVNFLFGPEMGDDYDDLHAFDIGPYPPKRKTEFLWSSDEEALGDNVEQTRKIEADWIAKRISQLLSDPTPRIRQKNQQTGESELRPVQPGDIVILFRAFSNLGVYEEALRKTGAEYYVVGGRAFFAQQEIYDFVNLCKFLDDDTDEVSLAGILRSPMFSWTDDCLMLMRRTYETLAQSILSDEIPVELPEHQQTPVANARRVLNQLLAMRAELGIGQLLRYAVSETAYDASLLCEFLGERKVANLQKLIEMGDEFDRVGLLGLTEFADRLLESISEEAREELAATHPETGNVVRLMTVHQSKGLEFPVVIVADVNRSLTSNTDRSVLSPVLGPLVTLPMIRGEKAENPAMRMYRFYENSADEQEAIRLFYVATTRAADHLILSAPWTGDTKMSGPWMKLLNQRFHLETGLPKGDSLLGQSQRPGVERNRIPDIDVVTKRPEASGSVSRKRSVRLSDWMNHLEKTTSEAPAKIALPFQRECAARVRFSVSEIEATDESLCLIAGDAINGEDTISSTAQTETTQGKSLPLAQAELLGDLLHAAVEEMNPQQPGDASQMIIALSKRFDKEVSEKLQQTAITRLDHFMNSSVLQELANAKQLYREAEFMLRFDSGSLESSAIIAGTVDCLVQDSEDRWGLIDYKTGALPTSAEGVIAKYGLQMTLYALAIKELTSEFPRSIRIVQLSETPRVVDLDLTPLHIEAFTKRITTAISHLRSGNN
ncbi:MAG: PD-(D/E)XK nuclease family protein, partial [Planctomycetaceae bacterium]|nr:PD-(D/E)XK nuclease family protein [Planctomycetaceae bacterium]